MKFSFQIKLIKSRPKALATLCILFTSIICVGLLGITIYEGNKSYLINQCKSNALDIASIAADDIDSNIFKKISSDNDDNYNIVFNQLIKYQKIDSVYYIYTMKYENDTLSFVVDADPDEEYRASFGDQYPMSEDIHMTFEGNPSIDHNITSDRWGKCLSAYAPIFDEEGKVCGIVGCDISFSKINKQLSLHKIQIIIQFSVFFILCYIIMFRFYSSFTKRDMLTGIPNYESLVEFGEKLRKKNIISDYSAVQINIRNFKYINSRIGSAFGDIVLCQYAKMLFGSLSKGEYCARTGSDNFMLLIKSKNEKHILDLISNSEFNLSDFGCNDVVSVPSRCGIYKLKKGDTVKDIMNYTSVALKKARSTESSDIVYFEKDMLDSMVYNSDILSDFHRALGVNEFAVYYQPKVNIETNDLCGAEALVRWIKDGKVIPPSEFIPILEAEGTIVDLDFFVFETVCQNISDWIKRGLNPVTVSTNFSKLHLANPNFAESIFKIAQKYDIPANLLEIELTESSGYSDYEALTDFVGKMNNANIHTSIDDFGTGYSSLSMLKDINVDVVKIDKSFLGKNGSVDKLQEKMLENVIKMINDLDRTVICEGIENEKQLNFLKSSDCAIAQGFFFDKPLPHDEFEQRLKNPHYDK